MMKYRLVLLNILVISIQLIVEVAGDVIWLCSLLFIILYRRAIWAYLPWLRSFWAFLKSPGLKKATLSSGQLFNLCIEITLTKSLFAFALLIPFIDLLTPMGSGRSFDIDMTNKMMIAELILFAPIMEEIMCRYGLKKLFFGALVGVLYLISLLFEGDVLYILYGLNLFGLAVIYFLVIQRKVQKFYVRYFAFFYFLSAILFGLAHSS